MCVCVCVCSLVSLSVTVLSLNSFAHSIQTAPRCVPIPGSVQTPIPVMDTTPHSPNSAALGHV